MSELAIAPEAGRPARSRAATRAAWAERLARFPASGLSPAQFCAAEGVSLPSFYAWMRRLAAEALDLAAGQGPGQDPGPRLLPVRLQAPFAYLREALPGLFALGEKPAAEGLKGWLPDRWLPRRGRDSPGRQAAAG